MRSSVNCDIVTGQHLNIISTSVLEGNFLRDFALVGMIVLLEGGGGVNFNV